MPSQVAALNSQRVYIAKREGDWDRWLIGAVTEDTTKAHLQ